MIAAHNAFTCYEPKHKIFKLFNFLWKCQHTTNDIDKLNVDYFDVRIRYKNGKWITCHGIVDLKYEFTNEELIEFFKTHKGRIVVERGQYYSLYNNIINYINNKNIDYIILKKDWSVIIRGTISSYKHIDCHYEYWKKELSFIDNIKRIIKYGVTIKQYARIVNPYIVNEKDIVKFIDYCDLK